MIRKVYSKRNRDGWFYDQRSGRWWSWKFDIRLATGRRLRESGFLSRAEAETAIGQIRLREKESRYGILRPFDYPTVEELLTKHRERIQNPHEQTRAGRVFAYWLKLLPRGLRVNELVKAHFQFFLDARRADGQAPSSTAREMNIISAAVHAAPLYFPVLSNWNCPAIARPKNSNNRRERVIQIDELMRVINWLYAPPRVGETARQVMKRRNVAHVFRMTLLCGGRRKGELCRLRWNDIDWTARVIYFRSTKVPDAPVKVHEVELTDAIAEILRERRTVVAHDCKFVFTSNGGEVTHYYEILRRACEAVGVVYGKNADDGFVTHDTRHTAATMMLRAGSDIKTVGEILGHSDRTMTMRYSHANAETKRQAMESIEEFATGTLGKSE